MPPYLVYPEPKPRGYNPLTGALEGSDIAYTPKWWMDKSTFSKFLDFFYKNAGTDRPVVLLFDSVSSHIDHDIFMKAKSMNIELYRIVPNATHIMQPLDKGVFGPLKLKWHLTTRKYNRENPGKSIGKENFAQKLTEAFLQFYKPLTVINAFKASGIYPVSSCVVTSEMLKPSLTFTTELTLAGKESEQDTNSENSTESRDQIKAKGALEVFEETLSTPLRSWYTDRIREGYDVEGQSPCFDVYRKLYNKAYPSVPVKATNIASGLDLLAEAAIAQECQQSEASTMTEITGFQNETEKSELSFGTQISPILVESLIYHKASESQKPMRKALTDTIPIT